MKGQLSVQPTFKSLNITKAVILLRSPLLVFDGHQLHYNSRTYSWNNKPIIKATYSRRYKTLILLCSDWRLYIFNSRLQLVCRLQDWDSKYSVGFEYIEQLSCLLLIGVNEIQIQKINIKTNILQTKFLSSVKFNIQRKQKIKASGQNSLGWNKGYNYNIEQKLLYVWSTTCINFYSLDKLKLQSSIKHLVKKEQSITSAYLNNKYKYTITGLFNGNVRVWRLPLLPISNHTSQHMLIHNWISHTRAVVDLVPAEDHRLIMSSSEDLTICLWTLQTFQLLRIYNFQQDYTSIFLVDQKHALAIHDRQLGELTFGKTMQFIMEIQSNIISFGKYPQHNSPQSFQITLDSNVGLQIKSSQLSLKDLNKMEVGYFYPPLKAQAIRQVIASPYQRGLYYMLSQRGQLYSIHFQGNASKIQHFYNIQNTLDSQGHALNQTPTFISFINIPDLFYDSEITEGALSQSKVSQDVHDINLITLGCNKGSIIVLNVNDMQKIRARFTYHRQNIISINLLQNQSNKIIVSYCGQDYIRFTSIQSQKVQCFLSIQCGGYFKFCKSFQKYLALVFRRGIFQIAFQQQFQKIKIKHNQQVVEHEGQVLSLQFQQNKRYIMSGGSDNKIKIWSLQKYLIYQIKLDEGLKYVMWSHNLQMFIAHKNKLLYLRDFVLIPKDKKRQDQIQLQQNNKFVYYDIKIFIKSLKDDGIKNIVKEIVKKQIQYLNKQIYDKQFNKNLHKSNIQKIPSDHKKNQQLSIINKASKNVSRARGKSTNSNYKTSIQLQQEKRKKNQMQNRIITTQKHIQEIDKLRKLTNKGIFPKIPTKNGDKFEQFINDKLISKKMLTRRDITLNRIIMKNLIKQQFINEDQQKFQSLKLDF